MPAGSPVPQLAAVVLCYRSGATARPLLDRLYAQLEGSGVRFELVLVANYWPGTGDETPAVVSEFAASHDGVVVVAEPKRGAMGWDLRAGLDAARADVLVVIDGDAQNPVDDVLRMYELLRTSGAHVAKGRRVSRQDGSYRALVSFVYNAAFRVLFRTRGLWDINGKPKGMTRAAYDRIRPQLRSDDWFADAEIVLVARRLGLQIVELPVVFLASTRPSLVAPTAILEFVVNMLGHRLRGRR